MSLSLDARQRAMLEEMGVRIWAPPASVPASVPTAMAMTAVEPAPRVAPTRPSPAPQGAAPKDAAPLHIHSALFWSAPQRLYANASDVPDVPGASDATAVGGWLIVADMPPGPEGLPLPSLSDEASGLLDQMLRALQLHRGEAPVHLVRAHRPAAAVQSGVSADPAAVLAATAPRIVLAMGPLSVQALLGSPEPLGRLRGRAHAVPLWPGVQLVPTYPPAYLLRNGADKARAWADLCLAAALFEQQAPSSPP